MADPLHVLWTPAGENMPQLGSRSLVDVTDGDTPTLRMPVRMLSVDTPEVTARSLTGAANVDEKFVELAGWIRAGKAPISSRLADHLLPRIETGHAGTLQFTQGQSASDWFKARVKDRLTRPNGSQRSLFIRTADAAFDENHRLLAYLAPSYSAAELASLTRAQRATFNLDLVESGWAAPFIIFPSIPGELDLPIFVDVASRARASGEGIWSDPLSLMAYEYRMVEKLHAVTRKIVAGDKVSERDRLGWRSRYCADMRTLVLYGPEDYPSVPAEYAIWVWPADVQRAIGSLNLKPSARILE